MTKPRFEDFQYTGPDDQAVIDQIVQDRQRTYAATGFDSDTGEQRLATYLTTPTHLDGEELVIRTTAFSDDNGRESGAVFDALIAESTGRRVIAANAPGVDYKHFMDPDLEAYQELTPEQKEDLRDGRFQKVGGAVMLAIHNAALEFGIIDREYILTSSSMGTALSAGALHTAMREGIDIRGVTIAEPVNHIRRNLGKLGLQFGMQNSVMPGYLEMNPTVLSDLDEPMMNWVKRVWDDKNTNVRYARALARGTFLYDLGNIDGLEDVPMRITHGAGSKLSPTDAFEEFASQFAQVADVSADVFGDENNPHDHPYTMTVQSVIDGVNDVVERAA